MGMKQNGEDGLAVIAFMFLFSIFIIWESATEWQKLANNTRLVTKIIKPRQKVATDIKHFGPK